MLKKSSFLKHTIMLAQTHRNVSQYLLKLLSQIPQDHEMFGEMEMGKARAPRNKWENYVKGIANRVDAEIEIGDNRCWMSSSPKFTINYTENNKPIHTKHLLITRFLAFLKDPSEDNWKYLTNPGKDSKRPFSHVCGRGQPKVKGQGNSVCINGIEHGGFTTQDVNESHKLCTNGALALCPGHGEPPVQCVFTHADGQLKPCLMNRSHVPPCTHQIPCYIPLE